MNPSLDNQLRDRVRKMPPGIFQELIEHCMVERDRWKNENHLLRSELYRIRDLVGTVDAEIITRLLEGEPPCPESSPLKWGDALIRCDDERAEKMMLCPKKTSTQT